MRITNEQLHNVLESVRNATGINYGLYCAYGNTSLAVYGDNGCIRRITATGTKRNIYDVLCAIEWNECYRPAKFALTDSGYVRV